MDGIGIVIQLDRYPEECPLCGALGHHRYCVPYYEEPVHEEIGAVLPNGDAVGGMTCCKRCHDTHHGITQN